MTGDVLVPEEHQSTPDRVDRDVDRPVIVVIGSRQPAAVHGWAPAEARDCHVCESPRLSLCWKIGQHLNALGVSGEARDGDPSVGEDEVRRAAEAQVHPRGAPAGGAGVRRPEGGPRVAERRRPGPGRVAKHGVRLPAGVRHEQVEPTVAVVVAGGDAHAGVRVGHSFGAGSLLEAEAEPLGIRRGPAGPGYVLVELVRVFVVGDVQVGPPVAVRVREERAEAVVEVRRLEPRLDPDFLEPRVTMRVTALVQVEEVADALVVRGKATDGGRHGAFKSV